MNIVSSQSSIPEATQIVLQTYKLFGHKSFMKLVCMNPGSRQPTVRAGEPESAHEISITRRLIYLTGLLTVEHRLNETVG